MVRVKIGGALFAQVTLTSFIPSVLSTRGLVVNLPKSTPMVLPPKWLLNCPRPPSRPRTAEDPRQFI